MNGECGAAGLVEAHGNFVLAEGIALDETATRPWVYHREGNCDSSKSVHGHVGFGLNVFVKAKKAVV